MTKEIVIGHLYPAALNLYGDRGNISVLCHRAAWRGFGPRVIPIDADEEHDVAEADLLFIGGGQDRDQGGVATDLVERKGARIAEAVERGVPLLAVCGGYQLLGRHYRTVDGELLPGVGLFDLHTEAGSRRLIGNIVIETELLAGGGGTVVGFENHAGRTYLGDGVRPLGRVRSGYGNNGEDGWEGAVYRHAVGTYLHGPLLPKNAALTDWLLGRAVERRHGIRELLPLDDALEEAAHAAGVRLAEKERRGGGMV